MFVYIYVCMYNNTCIAQEIPTCGFNLTNPNLLLTKHIPDSIKTPVKTITISFHVWRNNDSTGNYWQDLQAYRDTLRTIVNSLSDFYTTNWAPSDPIPNAQFIRDPKVRFVLDTVYYYNNTTLANSYLDAGLYGCNQYVKQNYPERLKKFPCHLSLCTSPGPQGCSTGPCETDQATYTMIQYPQRYTGSGPNKFLELIAHLAHEFGHNFNLSHPYNCYPWEPSYIYDPEFLWDLFGTQRQSWCTSVDINHVCYHDANFTLIPYLDSNTATNNLMGGCLYDSRHITALQCGRIHRALAVTSIRNYAWGYHTVSYDITTTQLWDHSPKMYQDIVVKSGVILTVTGEILMPYQGKIIIEQGGKLIIDGGRIKCSSPDKLWKGIEVWGTFNKSQISPDNVYQGQLEIINGGAIENAEVAVYVGKCDSLGMQVSNTGGGLIKATNAVFKNNKTGVVMMPFHNFLPSNPTTQKPNFSFFTNCTFETNSSWNIPNTYPDAFVKLHEVDGVCFNGCSFANTAPTSFAVYNRGKGIVSEDGFFYLKQYCANNMNPCTNLISTTFTNLYYAVDAKKINFDNTLSITKSVFNSNYRSIYISGILTPTITDNTISIPDFDPNITTVLPTDNNPYGLYLNGSTGYKVEDNTFNSTTANKSTKYGAIINGSGAANNRIYRNIFTNLYIGSAAQGQNRGSGTGLVFKCNEYTNCSRDINLAYVNRFVGSASMYQGSLTEPAANLFTHAGTAQSDIYNGSFTVNYYHSAFTAPIPRWVPKDYSTSVTLFNTGIAYNKTTQCPITVSGGGGTSKNLASAYQTIQSLSSEIIVIENQLNTLVDGGNTTLLVNEVTYSPTWEALDLRNNLLNKSPFLSDTVLASTVENESAMPPLMLTQVLTANPHAIKSENVKEKIENRQNAIPGYLMNEIENSGKSMSAKEHLESKALMLRNKRASEIYSLIIEYKQDTINKYALDSICSLLNFESSSITLLDQYAIMLQANRMNEANNYLTLINAQNDADLSYLATLVFDFKMNVKNADSLSVSDINQLTLIANSETSNCNNIARNILLKTNKISYTEPIYDNTQSEGKSRLGKTPKVEKQENLMFRIYPNPAKEWVIVYYKTEASPSTLEVCDLLGKVIYTKIIDQTEGELLIETSSFPSGNYFVKLQTKGATLKTEKLTISNK